VECVLEVEHLTKKYPNRRGVEDITFQVRRGDVYGLLGPNGAGKTTVMKVIANLCKADRGSVRIYGYDIATHFEQAIRKAGFLIEKPEAYEYMSGYRNLELALRYYPHLDKRRIDEVLEMVGLSSFKSEKVSNYSLGMKQRLGIAAAILSKPELLILDEPTNGLDIEGMVEIRELIRKLAEEEHITFLISSHLIHEMELICNRVGIVYNGKMLREGLLADILDGTYASLEDYFVKQVREERRTDRHA
jgi:ABC-2 type transport system ATP-binding protein